MAKKKKKRKQIADRGITFIGVVIMGFLTVVCAFLTIKSTIEYKDSKSYVSADATVVGDVNINRITREDKFGDIVSEKRYYDYTYSFIVDGRVYYGEKNNVEEYYGDTFKVLYDENDPNKFIIEEEAKFPIGLYIALFFLLSLESVGIYKFVADY